MLDKNNRIPVKNDMRAVISMTTKILCQSDRPVHNEVGEILKEACSDWFDRIEFLENQNKKYLDLLNKIENQSKEGIENFMSPEEYESFYQNKY